MGIGFLGSGQMATALARGWINAGLLDRARSRASDPISDARARFEQATGIAATGDNKEVVANCDLLILAVKPPIVGDVLGEVRALISDRHLVVSIAAGINLARLADALGGNRRLVRVMPNTPCLVGACAAAFSAGPSVLPHDLGVVEQLFSAVGKVFALPEHLLDAVTGLSGSGPAFVYVMIEALSDGGVRMGLPREAAQALAAQTVFGAAKMVLDTHLHPGILKDAVASPGGTTIAGLHALERGGLRAALMDAVEAAARRSAELGE
jgi:pyrroline-5-carboxylate reductase